MTFMLTLFLVSQAHAYHYGMAGCGIGSLVFKDQPGTIQVVAATLNNIVSPQTSAITSGTSGCYDGKASAAKIDYIDRNISSLKEDAARGQGETLDGLMTLLGCRAEAGVELEIKQRYQDIFAPQQASEILNNIKSIDSVQKTCTTLG
jgi:pyruvate/oxaloacetate carboxyltransferase